MNAPDGPNNDGIIIDSSRNVVIEDCTLNTREDCIALKSGLNEDGRRVGKPTENVIVRRTRATGGAGGITIGSDMSGGVRNVFVHDCHYDGPSAGMFRLQFGSRPMGRDENADLMGRLQREKIVGLAVATP